MKGFFCNGVTSRQDVPVSPSSPLSKLDRIHLALRSRAENLRTRGEAVFPSIRAIARDYGCQIRTAAVALRRLRDEGLVLVRHGHASRVIKPRRGLPVRQIVAFPLAAADLWLRADLRDTLALLERHLFALGLTLDLIIYDAAGLPPYAVAEEIVARRRADTVVFLQSRPDLRQGVMQLRDAGIRVVLVQEAPGPIAACPSLGTSLTVDWKRAHLRIFRRWKEAGISRVLLRRPTRAACPWPNDGSR